MRKLTLHESKRPDSLALGPRRSNNLAMSARAGAQSQCQRSQAQLFAKSSWQGHLKSLRHPEVPCRQVTIHPAAGASLSLSLQLD